jgi:hypothetical protein
VSLEERCGIRSSESRLKPSAALTAVTNYSRKLL